MTYVKCQYITDEAYLSICFFRVLISSLKSNIHLSDSSAFSSYSFNFCKFLASSVDTRGEICRLSLSIVPLLMVSSNWLIFCTDIIVESRRVNGLTILILATAVTKCFKLFSVEELKQR